MEHDHKLVGVGQLWKKTAAFYGTHFKKIAALALPLTALFLVITFLSQVSVFSTGSIAGYVILQLLIAIGVAFMFIGLLLYPAVLIIGSLHAQQADSHVSSYDRFMKDTYSQAVGRFGSLLWIMFLTGILGLAAYCIFIIPGIFVQLMLSFSIVILFAEKKTGLRALSQSWRYVKGRWWAVFGRMLLLVAAVIVSIIIIQLIFTPLSLLLGKDLQLDAIAMQLFQLFVLAPFVIAYIVSLYHSLRSVNQEELTEEAVSRSKQTFVWIVALGIAFAFAIAVAGVQIFDQFWPAALYSRSSPYNTMRMRGMEDGYGPGYMGQQGSMFDQGLVPNVPVNSGY